MEKKMLKRSLAVWMVLILLFVGVAPIALMEGESAAPSVDEQIAGNENIINEETLELLDENAEMVDNVTDSIGDESASEILVEEPVVEEVAEEPVAEEVASEEEDADVVSVDIDAVIAAEASAEAEE